MGHNNIDSEQLSAKGEDAEDVVESEYSGTIRRIASPRQHLSIHFRQHLLRVVGTFCGLCSGMISPETMQ